MLQLAISAGLVWMFFYFAEKNGVIDGFTSLAFIVIPGLIVLLSSAILFGAGASMYWILALELSYFIAPFMLLKYITEYRTGKIVIYSFVVLLCHFVGQFITGLLLGPL